MVESPFSNKDYTQEFVNKCKSKTDERINKTRIKLGEEIAIKEKDLGDAVCNCISPHANADPNIVKKLVTTISHIPIAKFTEKGIKISENIIPISKSTFDKNCNDRIEYQKKTYKEKIFAEEEINNIGKSICTCTSKNILPKTKNQNMFVAAMYDARDSLRYL